MLKLVISGLQTQVVSKCSFFRWAGMTSLMLLFSTPLWAAIHWNMDPEIFQLGPLAPRYYGLFFAFGLMLGFYFMRSSFMDLGYTEDQLNGGFVWFVVGTVVGARLGHCLFYEPEYYLSNPLKILAVWEGGLASHGGAIGIMIALIVIIKKYNLPFSTLGDRMAIAVTMGVPWIRVGNFFNSEMIGHPTSVPWAVVFERYDDIPRHPGQLYEALWYFMSAAILYGVYRFFERKPRTGSLVGLMFVLIFSGRFFIEQFKLDQTDFEQGMWLNMGQILSIPFVLLGLVLIAKGPTILGWIDSVLLPHAQPAGHQKSKSKKFNRKRK